MAQPKLGRNELKQRFQKGKMPTANSFNELIDSAFNLKDDSLDLSVDFGYEVQAQDKGALVSFFKKGDITKPVLKITQKNNEESQSIVQVGNQEQENLIQIREDSLLTISPQKDKPLQIDGTIGISTRVGLFKKGTAKADGMYHEILEIQDNEIQVFEIVACLKGPPNTGKHAVSHAIAIAIDKHSWFNKVRQTNSFFAWPWNKIKFKWRMDKNANNGKGSLKLYIKTRSNYWKKNATDDFFDIQYHVTKLWNNQMTF